MFELYTYEAIYALNEAQKMGSLSVEPEHILFGLRKEGVGSAARFLRQKKISFDDLKKLFELDTHPVSIDTKIGFSAISNEILFSVYNEAKESDSSFIGQKELFLKLVEISESVGAKLKELNATPTEDQLEHLDSKEYGNTLDIQPIRVKLGPADLNGWSWDEDEIIFDLMPGEFIDTRLKIAALSFMAEISQFLNMSISMADEGLNAEPMIVIHPDGTIEIHQERELQEQSLN